MKIKLLKSKIHRATVTSACLDYEGSISIDCNLLKAANIIAHEKVHVLNVTNGNRLETYALPSNQKGEVCINGAAAHLVSPNDIIIIASYAQMSVEKGATFKPTVIYPNEANVI